MKSRFLDHSKEALKAVLAIIFFVWLGWSTSSINAGAVLLVGFFLLVVFIVYAYVAASRLSFILLLAFALRFSISLLQELFQIFPYVWDENLFHETAAKIALQLKSLLYNSSSSTTSEYVINQNTAYGYFSAVFYLVIGESSLTMRIVNSMLGTFVAYYTYCISIVAFSKKEGAVAAALVTALMPSFVVFTSLHMRDSLIWLLSVMALHQFVLWLKYSGNQRVLLVVFFTMMVVVLRPANAPVFFITLVPFALSKISKKLWSSYFGRLLAIVVVLAVAFGTKEIIEDGSLPGLHIAADLKRIEIERDWRALRGEGAYLVDQTYQTWYDVVTSLPLRVVHFAFGPFLWQAKNWFQLLGAIEGFFFLVIVFLAFVLIMRKRKNLENPALVACILWFGVVGIFANAIIDSNYGTAIRHRMNYMTTFLILMFGLYRQSADSSE